jgi:serine/threonine protein kinase
MAEQILHRRNFLLHLQERSGYEGPVLLKEPAHAQLTTAQIAQLHNEYEISQKFAHLPGVRPVHALEGSESHPVLVLKYIEGNSLAEIAQRHSLDLPQKLQLAVKIADMVGQIHDAGLMHRDISSSNILVNNEKVVGDNGGVTIIDFGLATRIRRELISQPIEIESLAGSLAYLSPEQTGRMRRRVDHRSDLYSLGVTL